LLLSQSPWRLQRLTAFMVPDALAVIAVAVEGGSAEVVCELAVVWCVVDLDPSDVVFHCVGVGDLLADPYVELDQLPCLG